MLDPIHVLRKFFGYNSFRPGQEEVINNIVSGRDCLAVMPTSAGKSICYQVPALILPGVTLVVSPLISLMKDQVDTLCRKNIPATFLNSSLDYCTALSIERRLLNGDFKFLYISPEKLQSSKFQMLCRKLNISLIAIDEAHCISQWGYNFRPEYLMIPTIYSVCSKRPIVVAFTATATSQVKNDIIKYLNLFNPFTLTTGFDRANLTFKVSTPSDKNAFVLDYLNHHSSECGIIYCSTRKDVDHLFTFLSEKNFKVSKYHGGMSEFDRNYFQNDFLNNLSNIMIATNAFGMGVDKSNVRFVLHYNLAKDLEGYYQEAGRAGRDGKESECILLFSYDDTIAIKSLINKFPDENLKKSEFDKLNSMVNYCISKSCLRKFILNYFGENTQFEYCGKCSFCNNSSTQTDFTKEAKIILECIQDMHEMPEYTLIIDVLQGRITPKIKKLYLFNAKNYGALSKCSTDTIKSYIYELIKQNFLEIYIKKNQLLALTKQGKLFLRSPLERITY